MLAGMPGHAISKRALQVQDHICGVVEQVVYKVVHSWGRMIQALELDLQAVASQPLRLSDRNKDWQPFNFGEANSICVRIIPCRHIQPSNSVAAKTPILLKCVLRAMPIQGSNTTTFNLISHLQTLRHVVIWPPRPQLPSLQLHDAVQAH